MSNTLIGRPVQSSGTPCEYWTPRRLYPQPPAIAEEFAAATRPADVHSATIEDTDGVQVACAGHLTKMRARPL
ncbi:MAG: hypothetical protein HC902_05275 [Calothrix sp. SM1_5_4]|nr:hypothetical protein [Calothrix sp. SM1_5_4]